jgi:phage protein D
MGIGALLGVAEAVEPAECAVSLGAARREITDLYPLLTAVTIECTRHGAWAGRLEFAGVRGDDGRWDVQDAPGLAAWEPIRVEAVFGATRETILDGYVREVRAGYPSDAGEAAVTVELQDASLALDREHRRKRWGEPDSPTDDATVVRAILADHGLSLATGSGNGASGLILNQNGTDIAFLRGRAAANGYELVFHPDGVYFGPLRFTGAPQPTLTVYGGSATNCVSFSATVDGHAPEAVAYDTLDESAGAAKNTELKPSLSTLGARSAATAASGLKPFTWRLPRGGADPAALRARAQRRADEFALRVHAEGELDGALYGHVLKVGALVGVDGTGDTFDGRWYVDRVTHRFDHEGYSQRFTLLRNGLGNDLS